ncbi:MAG: hypothetical protein NVS3B2_13400 [Ramlibacter sp.]
MIDTPELIEALVADARPVRRLFPPVLRAALWLLLPALIFALLALGQGVRPDLAQQLQRRHSSSALRRRWRPVCWRRLRRSC